MTGRTVAANDREQRCQPHCHQQQQQQQTPRAGGSSARLVLQCPPKPCSSCWARGPGADLPAGQDPEYRPGSDTAAHTCPADRPFVAGGTDSCGCMAPYHNKVCDESRCCKSEYQCYGNCGDYTGLYIFLGVLGGLIFLCAVAASFRKRREEQVRCLPYTFSCAFPKLLCEKFVEFR